MMFDLVGGDTLSMLLVLCRDATSSAFLDLTLMATVTLRYQINGGAVVNRAMVVPTAAGAWYGNTYYYGTQLIVDSNGSLQMCVNAGFSGATVPTWATVEDKTTTDGAVVWKNFAPRNSVASYVFVQGELPSAGAFVRAEVQIADATGRVVTSLDIFTLVVRPSLA